MAILDWQFNKENCTFVYGEIKREKIVEDGKETEKESIVPVEEGNESLLSFETKRLKDAETKREVLQITAKLDNEENGVIVTSMDKLDEALLSLREFGIVFSDDNSRLKLKRKIQKVYTAIKKEDVDLKTKNSGIATKFDGFMMALNEYIESLEVPFNDKGLLYMPVADFDQLALDCGYMQYEIQGLRKQLKEKEYIRTVDDRYAIMVQYQKKPTRVIAFIRDKIEKDKNIKLPDVQTVHKEKKQGKKQEDKQ